MGDMTVDELMGKLPKFHSQQTEEQPEQMTRIKDQGYLLMMQNQPEISFRHRGLA